MANFSQILAIFDIFGPFLTTFDIFHNVLAIFENVHLVTLVKDYLKNSIPSTTTMLPRPIPAGAELTDMGKKATEQIQLDVLHPDFRLRRRSMSIDEINAFVTTPVQAAYYSQNDALMEQTRQRMDNFSSTESTPYSLLSRTSSQGRNQNS